jgi:uncharacterized Rossmann fold enzyme
MSELRFTKDDIKALAQKLAAPEVGLSEPEEQLLLIIFAAARSQVWSSEDSGRADIRITDLRKQLLDAFIPDDGSAFVIHAHRIGPI